MIISLYLVFFFCSLSECYFAGKGSALMLGSNEHLRASCDFGRLSAISTCSSSTSMSSSSHTGGGQSAGQVSAPGGGQVTSSTVNSSDIHQHLQSMFYLLRPEETLKMVWKKRIDCFPSSSFFICINIPSTQIFLGIVFLGHLYIYIYVKYRLWYSCIWR